MSSARKVSPYVALLPVLVGVFIAADDQTVIVTVLPQIMLDMRVAVTELDKASWTITGYLLGYLAAMPLIGRVSDVWGRRRVFFAAMAVFMAGSVAVAVVPDLESMLPFEVPPGAEFPDFELLIAARVFQAVGAGALVPVAIAIAGDLFPAGRRGLPLGLIGASAEAGGVIGPLWGGLVPQQMDRLWSAALSNAPIAQGLAGWLNQEQGWRWVFWINIPLSLVVLALVLWLLPPSPRTAARVDYAGGALIAASLAAMTLGLARIGEPDALMVGCLLLSAAALVLFIRRQLSHPQPLLPTSVFRGAAFGAASGTHVFVGAALIIGMVTLPLMANTVMGLTPLDGGLWLMRMTAAMPVGAVLGGLACQRWDYRVSSGRRPRPRRRGIRPHGRVGHRHPRPGADAAPGDRGAGLRPADRAHLAGGHRLGRGGSARRRGRHRHGDQDRRDDPGAGGIDGVGFGQVHRAGGPYRPAAARRRRDFGGVPAAGRPVRRRAVRRRRDHLQRVLRSRRRPLPRRPSPSRLDGLEQVQVAGPLVPTRLYLGTYPVDYPVDAKRPFNDQVGPSPHPLLEVLVDGPGT